VTDRLAATPNIEVMTGTEVTQLHGTAASGLEAVTWRREGMETHTPWRQLFLFMGAEPETEWLEGSGVEVDATGFVVTGAACRNSTAASLESCHPGVFAIGDVRSGSIKRVAAAVGEGAQVVARLHAWLAAQPERQLATGTG